MALDLQARGEEEDTSELSEMKCTACRRGEPTLTEAEIAELRPQVPDWQSNASPARSQRSVRYTDATEPPSTR